MQPNSSKKYLEMRVNTASKEQLLLMLFDGAIRFTEQARQKLDENEIEPAHNFLLKAQRIMVELMSSLDRGIGDDLYNNLIGLYNFVYFRLVNANLQHNTTAIDEALTILGSLRETWGSAVEKLNEGKKNTPALAGSPDGQTPPTGLNLKA
jgi:flagellar protein FliS